MSHMSEAVLTVLAGMLTGGLCGLPRGKKEVRDGEDLT